MAEWKIERRQGACTACERPFDEGERHVSTLAFRADVLARDDLCEPCFEARHVGTEDPGRAVVGSADLLWWFTRHSVDKKRTLQLDLPTLERLFLDLEGRAERHARELRYVLCLLLLRKRRLKLETIERDAEGESFLVKRPRHEARHRVFAFDFDADRMSELQSQLQAIFDGAEGEDGAEFPAADGSDAGEPEAAAAD